jgi:hypothetical protein
VSCVTVSGELNSPHNIKVKDTVAGNQDAGKVWVVISSHGNKVSVDCGKGSHPARMENKPHSNNHCPGELDFTFHYNAQGHQAAVSGLIENDHTEHAQNLARDRSLSESITPAFQRSPGRKKLVLYSMETIHVHMKT